MLKIRSKDLVVALLFAVFAIGAGTGDACARDLYWKRKVSLFDKLPVEKGDIVFLGNSITDGGEFNELFGMENIKNRGISADVIDGVEERLDQVTDGQPSKIFLLIGINDVSHKLSASRIAGMYRRLVKKIRQKSPDTRLYIQSIMPINNDFNRYRNLIGREAVVPAVNEELKKIAEEEGATYIDLWPALADPKSGKLQKKFTNDGLHLTGAGYKAWADAVRQYVTEP